MQCPQFQIPGTTTQQKRLGAASGSGLRRLLKAGVLMLACLTTMTAFPQNWQQTRFPVAETAPWWALAGSSDGSTLVLAGGAGAGIAVSTNHGASWTASAPLSTNTWVSAACSADGSKIFLASYDWPAPGPIAVSTNSGATWAQGGAPLEDWSQTSGSIACSADGNTVVAATGYGPGPSGIFVSTNTGASWFEASVSNQFWSGVACSADGTKMVAVSANAKSPGGIFTSTNSGATWTQTSAPTNNWTCVATSADGTKLVAAYGGAGAPHSAGPGGIYTSTNSGGTWTPTDSPSENWLQVVSSADGTVLAAIADSSIPNGPPLVLSTNSGATWTSAGPADDQPSAITLSADGTILAAAAAFYFDVLASSPVSSPPRILGIPGLVTTQLHYANPAGAASLAVIAQGSAPFSYQWFFDGTSITNATSDQILLVPVIENSEDGSQFCQWAVLDGSIIPGATNGVTDSQVGGFQVVVSNAYGSVTSAVSSLAVLTPSPMAPSIDSTSERTGVPPGGEAYFAVTAAGSPPFTYQWLFNGIDLSGQTNSSLTVTNAQASGEYSVAVSNALGGVVTDFQFTLENAPLVYMLPTSQSVFPGGSATFSVGALGAQPLAYQWSFDGTNLPGATNAVLTIPDVQAANAGNYEVVVTNSYGSASNGVYTLALSLTPSPPSFLPVQLSVEPSKALILGWNALIGQTYKVQFSTDLSQTNWVDLLTGLTATNGVLSATDMIGTNTQRFYRAVLAR